MNHKEQKSELKIFKIILMEISSGKLNLKKEIYCGRIRMGSINQM